MLDNRLMAAGCGVGWSGEDYANRFRTGCWCKWRAWDDKRAHAWQAEIKYVQEQMTALHKGLADIVGVSLDASLLHIISEVTAEAEDRCA